MKHLRYVFTLAWVSITAFAASAAFATNENFLEVAPGVEIFFQDSGPTDAERPALIFVPGWTFSSEIFSHQIAHFSKSYRVIVPDPRSQGRSTVTISGNDYPTHANDLKQLIGHLGLKRFVLIGWSFGCLETWGYIKANGIDAVAGHICIDLPPKPLSTNADDWVEGPLDDIAAGYHTFLRTPQGQREFVQWYADEVMVQRDLSADEMSWLVAQSLRSPPYVAAALFASGNFSNYLPEAKILDKSRPSLFVVAEHWSATAVPYLARTLPNTKVEILGGHLMFWEYPQKFNQLLDEFLAKASSK